MSIEPTRAPSDRSRPAIAAPIPLAPPVTSATRPANRSSFVRATARLAYPVSVGFDPVTDYPLGSRRPDLVATPSGLPLDAVTLDAARDGTLRGDDVRATAETLALQARVARAAGRSQLADGLERAAELTRVPEDDLLAVYTALRPGRSSVAELESWAERLEGLGAPRNAAFVREAAEAYRARGLVGGV
jgi:propanediol dehydratase small subunit